MNLKIYITTCNQNMHYLKPFSFLFNELWNPNQVVNIIGYDKPTFNLPSNFNFITLGRQVGGTKAWASDLNRFFSSINDEYFIHGLEDYFIQNKVDIDVLETLEKETKIVDNIGWIGLTRGPSTQPKTRPFTTLKSFHNFDLIELSQTADYRVTAQFNLWNREYMLSHLKDGYSPWDFEIHGSAKAINDNKRILACKGIIPVDSVVGVRNHSPNTYEWGTLNKKYIAEMKKQKVI